jgi:hypothetical protein
VADRARVEHKLAELDRQHAELAERLLRVANVRDELRERLAMLNRLVHDAGDEALAGGRSVRDDGVGDLRLGGVDATAMAGTEPKDVEALRPGATVVRGQAIREAAVRALAASPRAFEPVHYREWFELLCAEGLVPAGKDPLATFLTQLGRSPVVTRTSGQGVYMVDHEFPTRARRKLEQLRNDLRDAHDAPVGQHVADVTAVRERRTRLVTEVERLERELEEAMRSLASDERSLRATG